jgi:ubiquinone/menaquinone biosynthesis C-methylase UbiE
VSHRTDRLPHAVLDLPSRRKKGEKIERLLGLLSRPPCLRMLEVGTGSGGIAHYFGTHPQLRYAVNAVDVHDNRLVSDGYQFTLVNGTALPFADHTFDIVLSNHVIEHVGDESAQMHHLSELRRVMKVDGSGYLAVPSRWMLIEPHYKLAFLSWLPHGLRTPYLRIRNKGRTYDCEPLQMRQLEKMMQCAGLDACNMGVEALQVTLDLERPGTWAQKLVQRTPKGLLRPFNRLIPTLIYRFSRAVT